MKKKVIIFLYTAMNLSSMLAQIHFPSYPAPKMTEQTKQLINSSYKWKTKVDINTLPAFVDNSKNKYFPPIFSQSGNSCSQASGIRYLFTYEMNRKLDRDASIKANIFSYFYTWNFINEGVDEGGFAEQGLSIAHNCGIMSIEDFPDPSTIYSYRWMSGYDKYIRAMHYRVSKIISIEVTDQEGINQLKQYLYDGGDGSKVGHVVNFAANARDWKFDDNYQGPSNTGYKSLLTQLATEGAHAMTIVGYDDAIEYNSTEGKTYGAFIVANSYGSWYHSEGRYYLPYYFFLKQRDANLLSHTVTGMEASYFDPKLVFKLKLNYTSRDDISITIGAADKPYATHATESFPTSILSNQGGDHPMQGAYDPSDIEVAFDASSLIEKISSFQEPKFFLYVNRSERGKKTGNGYVEFFSVVDYRENNSPKEYICRDLPKTELKMGQNIFMIATTELKKTSASSCTWLNAMLELQKYCFIVRTAHGHYAKVQFLNYDKENGCVTLKYLYQPQNSRNLTNDF